MLLIDNIKSPTNNFLSEILPAWTKFIRGFDVSLCSFQASNAISKRTLC